MSEPVGPEGVSVGSGGVRPAVQDASASAIRAGQLLRQAREATGLHVAAVAVALKVPVRKLEALEAGRIDLLPDVTFARALAASVCRTLKVDAAEVLSHFPPSGESRLGAVAPAMNTPFRPPGSGSRLSFRSQMANPSMLAVVVLLVAAVAVALWPQSAEVTADVATEQVAVPGAAVAGVDVAATPMADAPPLAAVSAVLPVPVLSASAVVPPVAVPAASAPVVAAAEQALRITAKAESWVKVTDANGVVSMGRTLQSGEAVDIAGAFPMAVVLGRVEAVDMQVRGQAYDTSAFPAGRVARFEVK